MTIRDTIVRLLSRGEVATDPDEMVEITTVSLPQGPMIVTAMRDRQIQAQGIEYFNIATSTNSDYRILVPRRQAAEALSVLEGLTRG